MQEKQGTEDTTKNRTHQRHGLGVRCSIPRHTRLLLDSAAGHLDHPQAFPQMLDLDRGGRKVAMRQVALPLLDRYVRMDLCRAGL